MSKTKKIILTVVLVWLSFMLVGLAKIFIGIPVSSILALALITGIVAIRKNK